MCEETGFESVETYIASGNVVFESTDSESKVKELLEKRLEDYAGKKVDVFVRARREMLDLIDANPYPDEPGNKVAVLFLDKKPPNDLRSKAKGVKGRGSSAAKEVFIHYPDGLGTSKLQLDVGPGTTHQHEHRRQAGRHGIRHLVQSLPFFSFFHLLKLPALSWTRMNFGFDPLTVKAREYLRFADGRFFFTAVWTNATPLVLSDAFSLIFDLTFAEANTNREAVAGVSEPSTEADETTGGVSSRMMSSW